MKLTFIALLIFICNSVYSQNIIIQAAQDKEYVIADFINASVIYEDLSEEQIEEFRNYKNKYITNNLLLVEVLSEGPPDEFLFIASFSKDEHKLTLGNAEIKISYDNFTVNTSYNQPPQQFNYNFLSSELMEKYAFRTLIVIFILLIIIIPIYLVYRKRQKRKNKFMEKQLEWKEQLGKNLDRKFMEYVYKRNDELSLYFEFEKSKLEKFKDDLNKIQYKKDWNNEELESVISSYSKLVQDFRDKRWNTNIQI